MTPTQAKALRENDRVTWDGKASDQGTVIEVSRDGVKVVWDNGPIGIYGFSDAVPIAALGRAE